MISISTSLFLDRCGLERGFSMIADAGFGGYDLDLFSKEPIAWLSEDGYVDRAAQIRCAAEARGLLCAQTHAPFPVYFPDDAERTVRIRARFYRALESTAELRSAYMIAHPINVAQRHPLYGDSARLKAMNLDFYGPAADRARELGVAIALENLFTSGIGGGIVPSYVSAADELADLVDALPGTVACLDTGHCLVTGSRPQDAVRTLGKRLGALHVQGNDGVDDLHMPPYLHAKTDWDALADALRETGYAGWLNLETFGFVANAPAALVPAALKYQYVCGALLEARIAGRS